MPFEPQSEVEARVSPDFKGELEAFAAFGKSTVRMTTSCEWGEAGRVEVPTYVNEFWTAKQRAACRLHEISYRACFKPQLPRFFIERLTQRGDRVYDPFMGRGTTLIEAALMGRIPMGCDMNPLSVVLTRPRLDPPTLSEVAARLEEIPWSEAGEMPEDLLVFYHPETLVKISALRHYFEKKRNEGRLDRVDAWIEMVGLNRLTGHSPGFFSVYTRPPNQAVSVKSQKKINQRRGQAPPARDVTGIILKKSRILLSDCTSAILEALATASKRELLLTGACASTPEIESDSVQLVVTSPPFLDVVDYAGDNWLRCWFLGVDAKTIQITVPKKLDAWAEAMRGVFRELARVVRSGGYVAFEVGEIKGGRIKLEETVIPCGLAAGLDVECVVINDQEFTKTANCWGVNNNAKGTNTNRVVVFRKR